MRRARLMCSSCATGDAALFERVGDPRRDRLLAQVGSQEVSHVIPPPAFSLRVFVSLCLSGLPTPLHRLVAPACEARTLGSWVPASLRLLASSTTCSCSCPYSRHIPCHASKLTAVLFFVRLSCEGAGCRCSTTPTRLGQTKWTSPAPRRTSWTSRPPTRERKHSASDCTVRMCCSDCPCCGQACGRVGHEDKERG